MAKKTFSFKTILLEIFIVIVGISIAFWLNNWGEEQKERRLEMEFLKTLRSDLATDSTSFAYQIGENDKNVKNLYRFLDILRKKDYTNDSLNWFLGSFMNRNNWIINSNTYDILKSGGKLDIISDFEIRTTVNFFFRIRTFQTEKLFEVIQTFIDNQMHVYLVKNSDYFIARKSNSDFVKDIEFQNLLAIWTDINDQKLMLYEEVLADITQLISKLDAELK